MTRLFKLVAAAAALLVGFAIAPALAAPNAYVTKTSDVLLNPKKASTVIDEVNKNSLVTIVDCKNSFCYLQEVEGWVTQSALGALNKGKPSNAPFSFSFGVGKDGKPSIQIGVGNGGGGIVIGDDEEDEEDPQVCFYKNSNYKGQSFCAEPGDSDDSLGGSWDNAISSIELIGDVEVVVCRDEDFDACTTITSSKKTLSNSLNNRISSYEVE